MVKNIILEVDKRDKLVLIENTNLDNVLTILKESFDSFNNQRKISDIVASTILPYLKYHYEENIEIDTSSYNDIIKKVIVNYYEENNDANGHADIEGVNDEGCVLINLYISKFVKNMYSSNDIKREISNAISHELMHGNIYLQRYKNNKPLEDAPDYYEASLDMFNDFGSNHIFGKFAYALYSTYYQERQAFISMTNIYVKNRLENKDKDISTKELLSIIKDSSGYEAFASNIEVCRILINSEGFRNELLNISEKYGIHFDQNTLLKKLQWMKNVSEYSIKKIFKNTILALN